MNTLSHRTHILTVNVEDYFQVGPLSRVVLPTHWDRFEMRVEANTHAMLDLLDEHAAVATFFVLGWIGDKLPGLVREIADRGHEVASRGYFHRAIGSMTPASLREEATRSRQALEQASGRAVRGFRAAKGWMAPRDQWALDVLAELGFSYDSSLLPLGRRWAETPERRFVHVHRHQGREIHELPISAARIGLWDVPISGGNYVRQLPAALIERAIADWERTNAAPLVFYFHAWELDADQPRIQGVSGLQRLRQYRNLEQMPERIRHYLSQYRFQSIERHLMLPAAAPVRTVVAPTAPRIVEQAKTREPVTIVVPCYNEEATVSYLARTLASVEDDLGRDHRLSYVFVDDGSTDRTVEHLQATFGARADCKIVRHDVNRGIAAATLTGIREARTPIVATIDCDCSYDPRQLRHMLPMMTPTVDMVTASPYHPDGAVRNVPSWRLALSKGLSALYRVVLDEQLATFTSCFRVYRRSAIVDLPVKHDGFLGIAEILCRLHLAGGRIAECPAVLEVRLLGRSKMKIARTILGHLKLLAELTVTRPNGQQEPQAAGKQDA